jgi:hypothetical protein
MCNPGKRVLQSPSDVGRSVKKAVADRALERLEQAVEADGIRRIRGVLDPVPPFPSHSMILRSGSNVTSVRNCLPSTVPRKEDGSL